MKRVAASLLIGLVGLFVVAIPSAHAVTIYPVITDGAEVTIDGAIYRENDIGPTGSGVLDPFVRISDANSAVEEGYNTSGRPLVFQENSSPTFTHDLLLGDVPIFNISGTLYREFVLDINQTKPDSLLSLDELQIYLSNTAFNSTTNLPSSTLSDLGTLVYDLDASGDNAVELDYNLNSGSGSGDLRVFIPNAVFDTSFTYVHLYSKFGENFANNDGYEEWAIRTGLTCEQTNTCGTCEQLGTCPPEIPEPSSLLLIGGGLLGFLGFGISRKRA